MLLTLNLDSTVWDAVGIAERSRRQDGRYAAHKICVALIKEKKIRNYYAIIDFNSLLFSRILNKSSLKGP